MDCESCGTKNVFKITNVGRGQWRCGFCPADSWPQREGRTSAPMAVDTVYYKGYGNVSKARVEMMKRRVICPDGKGEVVMRDRNGKITDKRAYNY